MDQDRKNDFDSVAPFYDGLATIVFGGAIRRAQTCLLPTLPAVKSALIVGGGTGWFALELLRAVDLDRLVYVEKSRAMLSRSERLLRSALPELVDRVEFRLGTERSLTAGDGPFDLIVTNFFLDLFSDDNCARVVQLLHDRLEKGGRWLFVDFRRPDGAVLRAYSSLLYPLMFRFFNALSNMESRRLPDFDRAFAPLGLSVETARTLCGAMIQAKLLARA